MNDIEDEILLLMQRLDTEIYNAADAELSGYFFQWCKLSDVLLHKLKYGTASLEKSM